ncbi:dihydrofolate reductase [Ramlibacter sp. XY19]|uniref:dihydrofolate reductase n=1 Tax=Ramlibacter paludis TaxID=2908000 RepID=UPI0023DAD1EA|nr:dihydrofolate reductase [Ramlibacter paludis]MCG2593030.1 dihydrofolate reductase [Ramlibacter paludis]
MKLGLIYARARNGVIGKDNQMPWHLPEDLAHLKQTTIGKPVIMGRKTWDSLPAKFRPLPGRRNIVITRQPDWQAAGAERASTVEEAIALCGDVPLAWVIGGAEIYKLALPHADIAVVTEIDADFEGDVYAPQLGPQWQEAARERHVSKTGLGYSFVTFQKST